MCMYLVCVWTVVCGFLCVLCFLVFGYVLVMLLSVCVIVLCCVHVPFISFCQSGLIYVIWWKCYCTMIPYKWLWCGSTVNLLFLCRWVCGEDQTIEYLVYTSAPQELTQVHAHIANILFCTGTIALSPYDIDETRLTKWDKRYMHTT